MISGNPSAWLASFLDVHEKVLQVIESIWPDCSSQFDSQPLENKITDQLAWMLCCDPRSRGNWLVIPQHKLLASDVKGDVVTKGYIDFAIFFDLNQENYIAYECKRLNVPFPSGSKSLSDKYVSEGLMRYVSAQYAQELPFGVMVGYVLDGNAPKAIDAVKNQIKKKSSPLHCYSSPLTVDLSAVSFIARFSTRHSRPSGEIKVQHLFLPLNP